MGSVPFWLSLIVPLLVLGLFVFPRLRLAVTLYTASALLFTFSEHVASRFYYFPSLAVVLVIARSTGIDFWTLTRILGVLAYGLFWALMVVLGRQTSGSIAQRLNFPLV